MLKLHSFPHRSDALGAQNLVNPVTFFQNSHPLQVRAISSVGGAH